MVFLASRSNLNEFNNKYENQGDLFHSHSTPTFIETTMYSSNTLTRKKSSKCASQLSKYSYNQSFDVIRSTLLSRHQNTAICPNFKKAGINPVEVPNFVARDFQDRCFTTQHFKKLKNYTYVPNSIAPSSTSNHASSDKDDADRTFIENYDELMHKTNQKPNKIQFQPILDNKQSLSSSSSPSPSSSKSSQKNQSVTIQNSSPNTTITVQIKSPLRPQSKLQPQKQQENDELNRVSKIQLLQRQSPQQQQQQQQQTLNLNSSPNLLIQQNQHHSQQSQPQTASTIHHHQHIPKLELLRQSSHQPKIYKPVHDRLLLSPIPPLIDKYDMKSLNNYSSVNSNYVNSDGSSSSKYSDLSKSKKNHYLLYRQSGANKHDWLENRNVFARRFNVHCSAPKTWLKSKYEAHLSISNGQIY